MAPYDRIDTTFYWSTIVSIALCHRRRSREGPQVRTVTIIWLWGSAMAWILTIIWLNYRICSFLMFQTVHLDCHQQRSITLKMHQNCWRLGLRPRPHWGSLQRSPDLLAGLRRPISKGGEAKEEEGREGQERGGEGEVLWTLTMLETD